MDFCDEVGSRTFSLRELLGSRLDTFRGFRPGNRHVEEKVRQQLQFLRNDGDISFVDNSGHYTLRSATLLRPEAEETESLDLTREIPERREYLVETFVRKVAWARLAVNRLGDTCLYRQCGNTFFREDGTKYVEVHHIVPLCEGGEEGLWNLSVLCAHHHKMAHFADRKTRDEVKRWLLAETMDRSR